MTLNDILKPVYPVKEYRCGNFITRIQTGPDYRITQSVMFGGREIQLTSPLDAIQREIVSREPTVTVSTVPVGRVQAVRKPVEGDEYGTV